MARYQPPANSRPVVIGAAIVGGSILAAAAMVTSGLRDTKQELEGIRTGLVETRDQLKTIASAKPAQNAPAPQRRRGPDPDKRYTINTKGAPAKGPQTAKVELVEFSDFQ
jgi:hypothetical protein